MATDEGHYRRAIACIEAGDWPVAEGLLLRERDLRGEKDLAVADALAYVLLMQGDYGGCRCVLEPVLDHPQRSFWIAHKYGDALRGLHDPQGAARWFRRALAEGSTSALTSRNLLQVLHEQRPELALAELASWSQPWPVEHLMGVRQAAVLVAGLELAEWLLQEDLADAVLRRRLTEQRLYTLQPPPGPLVAATVGVDEADPADLAWCAALDQRLVELGLGAVSGPLSASSMQQT